MDPGTALAVVSLAIQLAGTVQTINEFLRTIRDAPSELVTLIETMDHMQSNLNQVHFLIEQQFSDSSLAGSPVFILNALKTCESRIGVQKTWVEAIKQSLTTRHPMKRTWASLNIRPKKTQLSEMQGQLRDAMANLHFAVTNNQWHVQLQQVQMTTTLRQQQMTTNHSECGPVSINEDVLSITSKSRIQYTQQSEECAVTHATSRSALHITSKEQNTIWYRGVFGSIALREKWISTSVSGSRNIRKPIPAKKVLTMTLPFLRRAVELYFGASFASVPRALRVYQIVNYDAPIFRMCRNGDLEGIENEFANGTISPFVVVEGGWTLLHFAAWNVQPEICSLLLRLGSDPNRADDWGRKALLVLRGHVYRDIDHRFEIMRTLTQAQEEFSSADLLSFIEERRVYDPEIVEYMLSLDSVRYSLISSERGENDYPALGAALKTYGGHFNREFIYWEFRAQAIPAKWELVLRKLLQFGVDVHAPVPRAEYSSSYQSNLYPCTLSQYGTPLDELFTYTRTAREAKDAADAWLQILSTEGIDILTYLEKEKALHATRPMFTCPQDSFDYPPRQLVFSLGEAPTVYADWWINPECPISLLRKEFKDTNIFMDYRYYRQGDWQEYLDSKWKLEWPISHPRWFDLLEPWYDDEENHATWERLAERAQERADRRWHKKARKAARPNGTQAHPSMPGAWPE